MTTADTSEVSDRREGVLSEETKSGDLPIIKTMENDGKVHSLYCCELFYLAKEGV